MKKQKKISEIFIDDNIINNELEDELNSIKKSIKDDRFIACFCLLKYINSLDNKYWILFLKIFEKLSFEEQNQILNNVYAALDMNKNKKDNINYNKVKVYFKNG